jgi:hypothetical protein
MGLNREEHEADHSPLSRAKDKNSGVLPPRDNFM